MTEKELLDKLKECAKLSKKDPERAHVLADAALLEFIDNEKILIAWSKITLWYA